MNNRFMKRKSRRLAISSIIRNLEQIRDIETKYYESIPDTPPNDDRQIESIFMVEILDDVVSSLRNIS